MSWTYRILEQLDPLVADYLDELGVRLLEICTGEQQQAFDNELDDLYALLEACKDELVDETGDPRHVLDSLELPNSTRADLFVFHRPENDCNIVYLRDVIRSAAQPIWIYQNDNQKERLQVLADLLQEKYPAG